MTPAKGKQRCKEMAKVIFGVKLYDDFPVVIYFPESVEERKQILYHIRDIFNGSEEPGPYNNCAELVEDVAPMYYKKIMFDFINQNEDSIQTLEEEFLRMYTDIVSAFNATLYSMNAPETTGFQRIKLLNISHPIFENAEFEKYFNVTFIEEFLYRDRHVNNMKRMIQWNADHQEKMFYSPSFEKHTSFFGLEAGNEEYFGFGMHAISYPFYNRAFPPALTYSNFAFAFRNKAHQKLEKEGVKFTTTYDIFYCLCGRDNRIFECREKRRILIRDKEILHKMWLPDVYFANSRIAQFHDVTQANFLLWIEPDGSILYDTRVSMVVICAMQLHHYPLDSQWCNLRMLSYAYDVEELVIAWIDADPITRNPNITLPDMQIERLEPGICDGNYSTGVWSCVTAEFFVSREITHHIMQTYVPTSLIVIISWFSFWLGLDVEAVPARVSLAITTLLTLSTQANSVRTTLPEVSYMRSIDIFLTISVLFVFGVMIEFVVTNYTQRKARACANMEQENQKSLPQKHHSIANAKDLGSKARSLVGRIFRTYTDQKNLIDVG
uniref:Neur_chan_LBD domain-containing protein n=1 Tax=Bursaphelenchus xylophilus TaxID=6326 RepID=A0A1I7SB72_BURXY